MSSSIPLCHNFDYDNFLIVRTMQWCVHWLHIYICVRICIFISIPSPGSRNKKSPAEEFPCDRVSSNVFPKSHWCKGTYWQWKDMVILFWKPPSGMFVPGVLQTAGISFNRQIQIFLWINVYKSVTFGQKSETFGHCALHQVDFTTVEEHRFLFYLFTFEPKILSVVTPASHHQLPVFIDLLE